MFWLLYNLHGCPLPAVALDNAIRFSILSRMTWFLWHSSKWACRFGRFLQNTSGLEVLAFSLDTDINYLCDYYAPIAPFPEPLITVAATFRGEVWQLSGCILVVGLD